MNNKATLLLISWYAADYAGNFIRSLMALAGRYDGEVMFVLPVEAKEKKWVSLLSGWQVNYISFEWREFASEVQRIKQGCGQSVVVHGHFLCDHHLRSLNRLFPRVIDHYHMTVPEAPNNPVKLIKYGLVRQVSRLSRGNEEIIGVSPQVASDLQRIFPRCKVYCIPNAIDFTRFKKQPHAHFCADSIRLLIFGTHYERKGVDLALTACGELRGRGFNIELVIATHNT